LDPRIGIIMARFTYQTVTSGLQKRPESASWQRLAVTLAGCGGVPANGPIAHDLDVYAVLTGGTERKLADLWLSRPDRNAPVLLVAHPEDNSLPAALEALAWWQQQGNRGQIVFMAGDEDQASLESALEDLEAWHTLRRSRIGVAGVSDWLIASSPDPSDVRRVWGPEVVTLDLAPAIRSYAMVGADGGLALSESVERGALETVEPTSIGIRHAADVLPSLVGMMEGQHLDAVTVRCFDLLEALGTSGCLALAELNDRGVVAGCEGDVPSTLGMLWARALIGTTSWMANPARVDTATNSLLVAHCTIARSMVSSYTLRSHFESGIGVAIAGRMPAGDYTMLRIGGRRLESLWLAEGVATDRSAEEGLCRTQLELLLDRGSVDELLMRPLGNHVVVLRGRQADRLHKWWQTFVAAP
jgi:L-fucose isomerase-like protein